jgi:hypothetical protein
MASAGDVPGAREAAGSWIAPSARAFVAAMLDWICAGWQINLRVNSQRRLAAYFCKSPSAMLLSCKLKGA